MFAKVIAEGSCSKGSGIPIACRALLTADAHRSDGKRFIVTADEKLTAFLELKSQVSKDAER